MNEDPKRCALSLVDKKLVSGETRRQQSSGDGTRMKNERVNYEMSVNILNFAGNYLVLSKMYIIAS